MTPRAAVRKGQIGEREFANLLSERLGSIVTRNLNQTRTGGHDLVGVGDWAVEVKRQDMLRVAAWWEQAVQQAVSSGKRPALAYRLPRHPWVVKVLLSELIPSLGTGDGNLTADLCVDGFCALIREQQGASDDHK